MFNRTSVTNITVIEKMLMRLFQNEKLMFDNLSVTDLSCELSIVPDNN